MNSVFEMMKHVKLLLETFLVFLLAWDCKGCQLSRQGSMGEGKRDCRFKIEMVILICTTSKCVKILGDSNIPMAFTLMQDMYCR